MSIPTPGVSLTQKAKGGTWYAMFRDPRDERRPQRKGTTGTADFDGAEAIAAALSRVINDPALWDAPPGETTAQIEAARIWGVRPVAARADEAIAKLMGHQTRRPLSKKELAFLHQELGPDYVKQIKSLRLAAAKPSAAQTIELLELLKRRDAEVVAVRQDNRRLTGLLKKMGNKYVTETEPKAIALAIDEFFASKNGTTASGQWRDTLRLWYDRLARDVGAETDVFTLTADALVKHVKDQGGKPGTRKKLCNNLAMFMEHATRGTFDAQGFKDAIIPNLEEEDEAWFWLSRKDALAMVKKMADDKDNGQYWADAALIQYGCGFRPEEIPLLQTANVKMQGKSATITVARIFDADGKRVRRVKTKAAADAVNVPSFCMDALKRRVAPGGFLLFPLYDAAKLLTRGLRAKRTKFDDANGLWPSADDHQFSNMYRPRLRAAAKAVGVKAGEDEKKVDARTMRRTCARELILAYGYEQAAAVIRDNVDTLRKHYANLQASDVSTERSA